MRSGEKPFGFFSLLIGRSLRTIAPGRMYEYHEFISFEAFISYILLYTIFFFVGFFLSLWFLFSFTYDVMWLLLLVFMGPKIFLMPFPSALGKWDMANEFNLFSPPYIRNGISTNNTQWQQRRRKKKWVKCLYFVHSRAEFVPQEVHTRFYFQFMILNCCFVGLILVLTSSLSMFYVYTCLHWHFLPG